MPLPATLRRDKAPWIYKLYLRMLQQAGFKGPLILHNLREEEVPGAVAFLRRGLNDL